MCGNPGLVKDNFIEDAHNGHGNPLPDVIPKEDATNLSSIMAINSSRASRNRGLGNAAIEMHSPMPGHERELRNGRMDIGSGHYLQKRSIDNVHHHKKHRSDSDFMINTNQHNRKKHHSSTNAVTSRSHQTRRKDHMDLDSWLSDRHHEGKKLHESDAEAGDRDLKATEVQTNFPVLHEDNAIDQKYIIGLTSSRTSHRPKSSAAEVKEVHALVNKEVVLQCAKLEYHHQEVLWERNNKTLESSKHRRILRNSSLIISHMELEDSGLYTCLLNSRGEFRRTTYNLIATAVPLYKYTYSFVYAVDECNDNDIEKKLRHIDLFLCHDMGEHCIYKISPSCNKVPFKNKSEVVLKVKQQMPLKFQPQDCGIECTRESIFKALNKGFAKAKQLVTEETSATAGSHMNFDPEKFSKDLINHCPMGFKSVDNHLLCVACSPGTVSMDGSKCSKCPKGTYQFKYGAFACLVCPEGRTSKSGGAVHIDQCIVKSHSVLES